MGVYHNPYIQTLLPLIMPVIIFNPQAEEPPMDKECTITFSNIVAGGSTHAITLTSGVNRHVPDEQWEQLKSRSIVKAQISRGVLVVHNSEEEIISDSINAVGSTLDEIRNLNSLEDYKIPEATEIINATHEPEVLKRWFAKTERITLRNTIQARLIAIEEARS